MTTVQDMWTLALDYADMTGTSFPVTARAVDYANTALRVLHIALVNARDDYFRSEKVFNLVSGTEAYDLPADFMRSIKLFYEPTNGDRRYPIERYHLDDLAGFKMYPTDSGAVRMLYAPKPTLFVDVGDELDTIYPVGSEDYIAYHMAVTLLTREESFEQKEALKELMGLSLDAALDSIEPRDEEESEVVDKFARWAGERGSVGENRDYRYRIMGKKVYFTQTDWRGV